MSKISEGIGGLFSSLGVAGTVIKKITSSAVFWYGLFGLVLYIVYKKVLAPKTPEETFLDTPLPTNGKGIPTGWSPDVLAGQFNDYYTAWFGSPFAYHDYQVEANGLSNDQFVYLVKYYNAKYSAKDGKTFYKRANNGWNSIGFGDTEKIFLNRFLTFKLNY